MPASSEDLDELAKALTAKERLFAQAYCGEARRNATKAAEIAGYKDGPGLRVTATRLLAKANVRAYIDAFLAAYSASAQEVLAELTDVAMAEWKEFISIKRDKDGEIVDVRMDLRSKVEALNILAKSHKLLTDKIDHSGEVGVTVREYPEGL